MRTLTIVAVNIKTFSSALILFLGACGTTDSATDPSESSSDPTLNTMDRILNRAPDHQTEQSAADRSSCLQAVDPQRQCPILSRSQRTFQIRLALDSQYVSHWTNWQDRLAQSLSCVNRLYQPTGINWTLQSITPWEPGTERNNLYALLSRLRVDFPPGEDNFVLGLVLWDERKVFQSSGGAIGLSQGNACVVPSWPRVENDCVILAHELGHLLGAEHVQGKRWIMSPAAPLFHLPAADPIARVIATFRFHPRNFSVINAQQMAIFTPNGLALPAGCIGKIQHMDRCWGL